MCEGLQEKLEQIHSLKFDLEVRDITTREDWFQQYQYEIPVLVLERQEENGEQRAADGETGRQGGQSAIPNLQSQIPHPSSLPLPRPSPRASVQQLEQMLQKYLSDRAQ